MMAHIIIARLRAVKPRNARIVIGSACDRTKPAPRCRPRQPDSTRAAGAALRPGRIRAAHRRLTSAASVNTALGLTISREQYVDAVKSQNPMRIVMQPADFEKFALKEAEAQYDRRLATIPLAVAGVVIACLLFSGAIRSMMGDAAALGTWALAATAAIPHRLLTFISTVVTGRDVERIFGGLKQAPWLEVPLAFEQTVAGMMAVVLTAYFAVCLVYLRRPNVIGRFSAGAAGSRPSA
jgi:hypothetical protein